MNVNSHAVMQNNRSTALPRHKDAVLYSGTMGPPVVICRSTGLIAELST